MTRTTIDFGIDLGTTNSSVAVLDKHGPHVLRNNEGMQYTPSAVWMDKNGAVRVGASAKDRLVSDPENSSSEFKLWMGKAQKKKFSRSQRVFTPEELSAEVLKSLKQDVKREIGEEIDSAERAPLQREREGIHGQAYASRFLLKSTNSYLCGPGNRTRF